jgi:hypothetical protein
MGALCPILSHLKAKLLIIQSFMDERRKREKYESSEVRTERD